MGKVEKVIVLSVLFLIALILVVSLTVDDPLDKSRVVEAGAGKGRPPVPPTSQVQTGADQLAGLPNSGPARGVLNAPLDPTTPSATTPTAPPATPAGASTPGTPTTETPPPNAGAIVHPAGTPPTELPPGALLRTLEGLQDSILTDMKLYRWKEGDSFRKIADTYYGDWKKFTVLRRSNEGRQDVQPGEDIFVPVFDSEAASVPPVTPVAAAPKTSKGGSLAVAKKDAARSSGNKIHVVKDGESLWKIAKLELGNGGRWEEIYELNKDVIPASKAVHKGLSLRMP